MKFHLLPWLLCGGLLFAAGVLKFCLPGYSFSALVCCILAGILAFYEITRSLLPAFPGPVHAVRTVFTICLALGILAAAVTEGFILRSACFPSREEVDYVVVLGAKVRPDGPSVSLWDRITAAYEYLEDHPDTVAVLSGGLGSDEPITEAECMYRELATLGIDPKRLLREEASKSTWENLNFSLDLIEKTTGRRPEKIGVLSSEYHLFRAELLAKKCGVEAVGIPARTSRPTQLFNHLLREIAGVWHFIILGE